MTTQFTYRDTTYALDTKGELSEKEEIEAVAVLQGHTCKQSAKNRGVSPETVKAQRASAKSKLGAHSLPEFVMGIINRGWLLSVLRGLLRRATLQAKRGLAHLQAFMHLFKPNTASAPEFVFRHSQRAAIQYGQLSPRQRDHLFTLDRHNAARYMAFLATRKAACSSEENASC